MALAGAPPDSDLEQSASSLRGVGPQLASRLERLGIHRVADLLLHLPYRYQDRTHVTPIGSAREGEEAVVEGVVEHAEVVAHRRRMLVCSISDGSGRLLLRFFHFGEGQRRSLAPGRRLRCFGELRRGPTSLEMVHPEYRDVERSSAPVLEDRLTPIYPASQGVSQRALRQLTEQALAALATLPELLPAELTRSMAFPSLASALRYIHRPPPDADRALLEAGRHPSQQRLAFEELLAHNLSLQRLRQRAVQQGAPPLQARDRLLAQLRAGLHFDLTGAQERVIGELLTELSRSRPMLRLLQGDVGSGKTIVAGAACARAVEAGWQAAVMAPTEILAEQHYHSFHDWLGGLGVTITWISGSLGPARRREAWQRVSDGEARVVIGTHALFQREGRFDALGLVVVDEQHRFGVHQRLALREKGSATDRQPHQLIMTATPIPRTLAMTAYADLDVSVLDELPSGRKPVRTVAVSDERRTEVVERISRACAEGRQAYWVCTLIEESEAMQCQAAEATYATLAEALPHLRLGLVHGRMRPADKEDVVQRFRAGEIDLLVATTVIEVGVDVPNASLMIIENAERLGLAQLHQLRGRVGRGGQESSCLLMYRPPLSEAAGKRLDALRQTNDGFRIAEVDLDLRGPGEVLGTRQTGPVGLRVADLQRDGELLPLVHEAARRLSRDGQDTVARLIRRWLGDSEAFGRV